MRDLRKHKKEVLSRIARAKQIVLMLDFDGVLAPIVRHYRKSVIDPVSKRLLKTCARHCFVAVISGRDMRVLRQKVGIIGIAYAGNHGFEWRIGGKNFKTQQSAASRRAVRAASKELLRITAKYPGARLEDKGITLSLHYRRVSARRQDAVKREVKQLLRPYVEEGGLNVLEGQKIFDVRPNSRINKGTATRLMVKHASKALSIFIGDDVTDEDAFRALPNGITIRVGQTRKSAARYVIASRRGVNAFLKALIKARTRP